MEKATATSKKQKQTRLGRLLQLCAAGLLAGLLAFSLPAAAQEAAQTPNILQVLPELLQQVPAQALYATVPALAGHSVPAARELAEKAGVRLAVNEFQRTGAPRYRVSRQRPAAGTKVKRGAWVYVDTKAWVQVPALVKRTPKEAQDLLAKEKLVATVAKRFEAQVSRSQIARQAPSAGTWVEPGSHVALWIARPPAVTTVLVPKVTGLSLAQAEAAIKDAGLASQVRDRTEGDVQQAGVQRQRPVAGKQVQPGSVVGLYILVPRSKVRVPDIVTLSRRDAEVRLAAAKLRFVEGDRIDSDLEREQVARQIPQAGQLVAPGTAVRADIAVPLPKQPVPNILGQTVAAAKAAVVAAGFSFSAESEQPLDPQRDKIVSQKPVAGSLLRLGAEVTGQAKAVLVPVPNIVGETVDKATAVLREAGFSIALAGVTAVDRARHRIIDQTPKAGRSRRAGATVQAGLAPPLPRRKPQITVAVPDVVGRNRRDAERLIRQADLTFRPAGNLTLPVEEVRADSQSPAAGTEVRRGAEIAVTFLPVTVSVPEVMGETRASAAQAIQRAGLEYRPSGELTLDNDDTEITAQSPQAGQEVPLGSAVTVTVGSLLVPVPAVKDLARDQAAQVIQGAGLQVRLIGEGRLTEAQQPPAGTMVRRGSEVTLTLAPAPVTVPNLRDLTEAEAFAALTALGLKADALGAAGVAGALVGDQSPQPGATAPRNSRVVIVLKTVPPPPPKTLLDWLIEQQQWVLAAAGLFVALLGAVVLMTKPPVPLGPSRVVVQPAADPGVQSLEAEEPLGRGPNIRVRPRLDPGRQLLILENDDEEAQRYG